MDSVMMFACCCICEFIHEKGIYFKKRGCIDIYVFVCVWPGDLYFEIIIYYCPHMPWAPTHRTTMRPYSYRGPPFVHPHSRLTGPYQPQRTTQSELCPMNTAWAMTIRAEAHRASYLCLGGVHPQLLRYSKQPI